MIPYFTGYNTYNDNSKDNGPVNVNPQSDPGDSDRENDVCQNPHPVMNFHFQNFTAKDGYFYYFNVRIMSESTAAVVSYLCDQTHPCQNPVCPLPASVPLWHVHTDNNNDVYKTHLCMMQWLPTLVVNECYICQRIPSLEITMNAFLVAYNECLSCRIQ